MLKKTVTYVDFDGNERTEDLYFNLSKAELMEMQFNEAGGLETKLKTIMSKLDGKEMIQTFKELILNSYGEKSPDGKRFIKNKEIRDSFEQTEAYSQIFMELVLDPDKMGAFIRDIMPKDLSEQLDAEIAKRGGIENITPNNI